MTEGKRNIIHHKRINSSYGSMEMEVHQYRKFAFEPQVMKKRQKDSFQMLQTKYCHKLKIGRSDH